MKAKTSDARSGPGRGPAGLGWRAMGLAFAALTAAGCPPSLHSGHLAKPDRPVTLVEAERPRALWVTARTHAVLLRGEVLLALRPGPRPTDPPKLVRLSLQDGEPRWSVELGGMVEADPVLAGDRVVVPVEASLLSLEADSGARAGEVRFTGMELRGVAGSAPAAVACTEQAVQGLAGDEALWTRQEKCKRIAARGDVVVALADDFDDPLGPAVRVEPATGETLWTNGRQVADVVVTNELVLTLAKGRLRALAPQTGAVLWSREFGPLPKRFSRRDPLSLCSAQAHQAAGRVAVATCDHLAVFEADSGERLWTAFGFEVGSPGGRGPVAFGADSVTTLWRPEKGSGLLLVEQAASDGAVLRTLGLSARPDRLWWRDGTFVAGLAHGTTATYAVEEPLPSINTLTKKAPAAVVDSLLADRSGDPGLLGELLAASLVSHPQRDKAAARLAGRLGALSVEQLAVALPALRARLPRSAGPPLAKRLPQLEPKGLRERVLELLGLLKDDANLPAIVAALATSGPAAMRALVRLGSAKAMAAAVKHRDKRLATPYRWDPCADFHACKDEADGDQDGWPDSLEARLGTDPANPDSDGDGLQDGADPCPLLSGGKPEGTPAAQLQAALLALPEVGSAQVLSVDPGLPPVCLRGASGPTLHHSAEWLKAQAAPGLGVALEVTAGAPEKTVVRASLSCGPACGFGYDVTLVLHQKLWLPSRLEQVWAK